jgi:hypothetical protein
MSQIGGGSSNLFIGSNQTQNWIWTWNNAGWQGNTFAQPQPLNTGAAMSYTNPTVSRNNNGTFSFAYSVTNHGPNSTFYNLQTSNT